MPPEEAGYTYAVEPTATNRLLANEEESIYSITCKRGGVHIRTLKFDFSAAATDPTETLSP
jgi:hypothetical protein